MIRYYCDRCDTEIKAEQYNNSPCICLYKEDYPKCGVIEFPMIQSDCKLCVDCMSKYIKFLKGGDGK